MVDKIYNVNQRPVRNGNCQFAFAHATLISYRVDKACIFAELGPFEYYKRPYNRLEISMRRNLNQLSRVSNLIVLVESEIKK